MKIKSNDILTMVYAWLFVFGISVSSNTCYTS